LERMWYEEKWRLIFKYSSWIFGRLKKTSVMIAYRQKGIWKRHHRSKKGGGGNNATGRVSQLLDWGTEEYNKESQCNELQAYTAYNYGVGYHYVLKSNSSAYLLLSETVLVYRTDVQALS
jgi:hypothetical protein